MMRRRRVAVVGSRKFANLDAVRQYVRNLERSAVVISGGADGPDRAAVREAERLGMASKVITPDWLQHGRAAGPIRNRDIVEQADEVVAFWDGSSRGTKNAIDIATRLGKPLVIIR